MTRLVRTGDTIIADLDAVDEAVLRAVPVLVRSVGDPDQDPAADRLQPEVYRGDQARSAEFRELADDLIEGGRRADLAAFEETVGHLADGEAVTLSEAEATVRILTTARLILGARLGIEEDGWEEHAAFPVSDPRVVALHVLAALQGELVRALSFGL